MLSQTALATSEYTALVAARTLAPFAEIEIFSTPPDQSAALVAGNCVQVSPPSVLLKMPAPRNVLPPEPPPVPAYIVLESPGLIAIALTARFAMKSFAG